VVDLKRCCSTSTSSEEEWPEVEPGKAVGCGVATEEAIDCVSPTFRAVDGEVPSEEAAECDVPTEVSVAKRRGP
jgi:hypothetical protein